MFGPGTACRCSTCVQLPKKCEWGGGPYAGVLLLYLQEIAINRLVKLLTVICNTFSVQYPDPHRVGQPASWAA